MRQAIFFDRDGVINPLIPRPDGRCTSPWRLEEFVLLPRVQEAFALVDDRFDCFVFTNQPHVGHEMTDAHVCEIHAYLRQVIPQLKDIVYCSSQGSMNYKPNCGMITDLVKWHQLSPFMQRHYVIGDRWKDILCGHNAGTRTIFVGNKYDGGEYTHITPDHMVSDIYAAVELIMENTNA